MAYTSVYDIMTGKDDYTGLMSGLEAYTSDYFDTIEQLEDETISSYTYHVVSCKVGSAEIRFLTTSNTSSSAYNKVRLYDGNTTILNSNLSSYGSNAGAFRSIFIMSSGIVLSTFSGVNPGSNSGMSTFWLLKDSNGKAQIVYLPIGTSTNQQYLYSVHEDGGNTKYYFSGYTNDSGQIIATPMATLQGICANAYLVNVRPFYNNAGPFELTVDGDTYFSMQYNVILLKTEQGTG